MVGSICSHKSVSALLILLFLAPFAANAAAIAVPASIHHPSYREEGFYHLYWSAIRIGKCTIVWTETKDGYQADFRLKTTGIARVFNKQDRVGAVKGSVKIAAENALYAPREFSWQVTYPRKKKTRKVAIAYGEKGEVTAASVTPPDNRENRPEVPAAKQDAALDPLSAAVAMHAAVLDIAAGRTPTRSFEVFDGRRLTRLTFAPASGRETACGERCFVLSGARTPLMGYTAKEMKEYSSKGDPKVFLEFIPEKGRMPQKISARTKWGTVTAVQQ